ncbi:hypothetical protein [Staphylococcus caprae]|uniref:hypothetical protein n=1 Tax=Staphylococcus caprae TaxID=29380 RepID=UPI003B226166
MSKPLRTFLCLYTYFVKLLIIKHVMTLLRFNISFVHTKEIHQSSLLNNALLISRIKEVKINNGMKGDLIWI